MSTTTTELLLDRARQALRERQGGGARWDAQAAPHADLGLARRGVAFFARHLNGLSKDDLSDLSRWTGKTRREVAARLAYFARQFAVEAAELRGAATDDVDFPPSQAEGAVALAGTLPDDALRYLVDHSAIHLNCEWRDLADAQWATPIAVRPLQWAWANWLAAVAIGPLARLEDLPKNLPQAAGGTDPLAGTLLAGLTLEAVRGNQRIN